MPTSNTSSVSAATALAVAISAFAAIGLFWAVVLLAVVFKDDSISLTTPSAFWNNLTAWWQYWYGFVGAVMGGVIGLLLAMWYDGRKAKREKAVAKAGLTACLRYNLQLIDQATDQIKRLNFPDYPLDHDSLSLWIGRVHGLFSDDLVKALSGLRFQYLHISKKMEGLSVAAEAEKSMEICGHLASAKVWTLERLLEIQSQ